MDIVPSLAFFFFFLFFTQKKKKLIFNAKPTTDQQTALQATVCVERQLRRRLWRRAAQEKVGGRQRGGGRVGAGQTDAPKWPKHAANTKHAAHGCGCVARGDACAPPAHQHAAENAVPLRSRERCFRQQLRKLQPLNCLSVSNSPLKTQSLFDRVSAVLGIN